MVRVPSHHRLEHRDEFLRPRGRLAVGGPELPGPQHHQALAEHRGRVEVVRVLLDELPHGVAVFEVKPLPVRLRIGRGIPLRQRTDVVPLALTAVRNPLDRLLHRVVRGRRARRVHLGVVVVRPDGEREAPVRHRRRRIELRCAAEVPRRLVVVETVEKGEPLVEVLLRLGVPGRDGVVPRSHPGLDLRRVRRHSAGMVVLRRSAGSGERNCER